MYGLRGEFSTSSSGRGIEARREPVGAVTVRGAGSCLVADLNAIERGSVLYFIKASPVS